MDIAIVGCGLIGRKRAEALPHEDHVVACCDSNFHAAEAFGNTFGCKSYTDYRRLLEETTSEAVVVSVVNKYAVDIAVEALKHGKHVLAEKPLGRNKQEAVIIENAANSGQRILKTGFNHRFHPAVRKAKSMFDSGAIGKVLSIRARYGHGGRPGMEKEWRASKELCGGGELLDQGVHVIDLCRWFAGEMMMVFGVVRTKFWSIEVEDNAFVYMQSKDGADIQFNVSWTNWKNIFSFEVFGTEGYFRMEGLGGNYGPETLEYGKRRREGGRPDIEVIEFPREDVSWMEEWLEFRRAVDENRPPVGDGHDGMKANEIIDAIYRSAREGGPVLID